MSHISNTPAAPPVPAQYPYRRYLEEITSLHRQIDTLVNAAQSECLRSMFHRELSIDSVPAEHREIQLPNTEKNWKTISNLVAQKEDYVIQNPISIRSPYKNPKVSSKVHCECLLVKHFDMLKKTPKTCSWANIPPFNYLGVSKLSCWGCSSWLKAYNLNTPTEGSFFTKGTHGRWCFPWASPELSCKKKTARVRKAMAEELARHYCFYQEKRGKIKPLSGTNTPSTSNSRLDIDT